jgi:hypothetical protein
MNRTSMLVLALAAAAAAQPPAALQQLGVAGRTVDDKGQPLRKVILTLLPLEKNAVGDPLEPYGVTSDSEGKFEFYGVAPGSYRLIARWDSSLGRTRTAASSSRGSGPASTGSTRGRSSRTARSSIRMSRGRSRRVPWRLK